MISCDEIICIEHIVDLQATYSTLDLTLSKLLKGILRDCKHGIFDILDLNILLYSLKFVPFTNESKGIQLQEELSECIKNQLYSTSTTWNATQVIRKIQQLQDLILWDYTINGSLIVHNNGGLLGIWKYLLSNTKDS